MRKTMYRNPSGTSGVFNYKKILLYFGVFVAALFALRTFVVIISHKEGLDVEDTADDLDFRPTQYGIIGDLGNSGSRLYLFQWSRSSRGDRCTIGIEEGFSNLSPIPNWEELIGERERNEVKPAITAALEYPDPYDSMEVLVKPILTFAMNLIPYEERANTPIFLFATAGIRLVAERSNEKIFDDDEEDHDYVLEEDDDQFGVGKIAGLMDSLYEYVNANSPFRISREFVKILTGEEEALFGWLSMQQFLRLGYHTITKENNVPLYPGNPVNGVYDIGMIDCGGGSVQLSYVPEDLQAGNFDVSLFSGNPVSLFSRSFLGYGMYDARYRFETMIKTSGQPRNKMNALVNPCMNEGYIHGGMMGSGNYYECKDLIDKIFTWKSCDSFQCSMEGVGLPAFSHTKRFLAVDNAYRTGKFFGCAGFCSIGTLIPRVVEYCSLTLDEAMERYLPEVRDFRIKRYCFEGVYLIHLLEKGFHIPIEEESMVFSDYIGGMHVNWGLGAMAYQLHHYCRHMHPLLKDIV